MSLTNTETCQIIQHIQTRYGVEPEFLWRKTPSNAVFRHSANKKWFGALLMDTPRDRLGLPGGGAVDILDLKCDAVLIGSLLGNRGYLPAYHMNKEHWVTVLLDGTVPLEDVFPLIEMSYDLTKG